MSARCAAAELLTAVLDEGRALEDALQSTPSFADLEGPDRGFARAMAAAALRRLGGIDALLAGFLARPLPDGAVYARAILRIGAAQLLVLGTPAHAAVSATVDAANARAAGRPFAGLVNAVLRRLTREGPALFAQQQPGVDLPAWLFTRWRAAYGPKADAIAQALRTEPPLDITVKADAAAWAARLGGATTPTGSVRLPAETHAVTALDGFDHGAWWVQDAAAALPARMLGDVAGLAVLDLCAAPGGKTLQLAAMGARVTAVDRAPERLERLHQNLARTHLHAKVICADALALKIREPFDAVLLDAPCTSTGTLRRHPDVAWLRRPDDIRKLAALQSQLLAAAAAFVKAGGRLVYAVCSLEPEEGEGVVTQACANGPWRREPLTSGELPGADGFITADGDLRTLPCAWTETGALDGFFAARLVRA